MAFKGPDYSKAAVAGSKFTGPVYSPPSTDSSFNPLDFTTDTMRNFNDALTFGLYDKLLEALGIDKNASAKTAASGPIPKILGHTFGGMPGGIGVSSAVSKVIPALAKPAIKSIIGNSAVSSGTMSVLDQIIRDGKVDPARTVMDTGLGAATGAGMGWLSRAISPGARVRAAGSDLTEAEKAAAYKEAASAADVGIPLTVPEAVSAVAPTKSGRLIAQYGKSEQSPAGSAQIYNYEQGRAPKIEQAGRNAVGWLGPAATPNEVSDAAKEGIADVGTGFRMMAEPHFDAAAPKKAPPSHVKSLTLKEPGVKQAVKAVSKDKVISGKIEKEVGDTAPNRIAYLSRVAAKLRKQAGRDFKNDETERGSILKDNADQVEALIDRVSPTHKAGRDIKAQGSEAIAALEAGPLGQLAKSGNLTTQANALFSGESDAAAAASREAMAHMPDWAPKSVLANALDKSVSKDGPAFASKVLPTSRSVELAEKAAGTPIVGKVIRGARAVNPSGATPHIPQPWSPLGYATALVRNFGTAGVAKKLQDPEWIKKMGITGPVQKVLTQMVMSLERTASQMQGSPDGMVHITIGGGR